MLHVVSLIRHRLLFDNQTSRIRVTKRLIPLDLTQAVSDD
jgi:hypothetical protein